MAYSNDLPTAMRVIKQTADELWRDDEEFAPLILEEPEVWGVEALSPNGVVVRLVVKTRPLEQWKVQRELRARIKAAFEREGIELPVPLRRWSSTRPPNSVRQVQTGRPRPGRLCAWPSRRSSRWSSPAARASGWPR